MNVDDVPLVMQHRMIVDHLQFAVRPSVANSRLTFHNFSCSDYLVQFVSHNSVAVQSNNDWPPRFLFDVAYGCAALKTWGVKEFVQFTVEKTKEFYYHDVGNDSDDGHSVRGAGVRRNKTVRAKKADRHSQTETLEKARDSGAVDILDVVVGLWAHNARKDMRRARMMKEEQTRRAFKNGFTAQLHRATTPSQWCARDVASSPRDTLKYGRKGG
jgi:hypothetical protein